MATWKEYLELVGILLGVYAFFRVIIWMQFRWDSRPALPSKNPNYTCCPIDASPLAERLRDVRQDYRAQARAHQPFFVKRALLVASRREQMAKLAFFQKPQPEPSGQEPPSMLLLAL